MSKKIELKMKTEKQNPNPSKWIQEGADASSLTDKQKTKRLTIDISEEWHRQIKAECAKKGIKMVDELRKIIKAHFIK